MADYGMAYQALIDKYKADKEAAGAMAPTAQEQQGVQDQQGLAALVSNLMKAQANVGSIGGKASSNPDIDYAASANMNAQGLKDKMAQSQAMQQQAMQGLDLGRQQQSDMMGVDKFAAQQQRQPFELEKLKADTAKAQAEARQVGMPKLSADATQMTLDRIAKKRSTADLFEKTGDKATADRLRQAADIDESKVMEGYNKANKEKAPSEGQTNAAAYATRADEANIALDKIISGGFDPTAQIQKLKNSDLFPNMLKGEDQQSVEQAQRNFINSVLRRESGAAISPSEFENARQQYFPQPGDKPANLESKKKNRDTTIAGLKASAGDKALNNLETHRNSLSSSKPKTVVQNGHTYTLNESTGQYE